MNTFRRQFKLWIGCVAVLPVLAACASESGDVTPGDGQGETLGTTTDNLDTDLGRVAVSLSTDQSALAAQRGLAVTVTMTNTANHAVRLLKWKTPVDGINESLFVVARDGAEVAYTGRVYKRIAPRASDYVVLRAGESLTRTVDLAETYDLSVTGHYTVHFRADTAYAGNFRQELVSNDVGLWVEGRPSASTDAQESGPAELAGTITYTGGCTASEKTALQTGFNGATTYANGAVSYLNGTPGSTPRYTTWFGAYTSARWGTAKSHFAKIKDAFDTKNVTLDCSCNDSGVYAYVYPGSPYKIYLCGAFWSAPQTGTDSKAGTLVHEMSHFTVVAGTDDHAYGQSACKSLAKSNPTNALDNADSHEYFAENNPPQN
ncbi:M35 family metallo-endopeptidase [Pendulispora albinea]|uniref:M35 family metallo-endopeptidase n=1 Tax=Pendulispora albinea TaxID=2741071 RepID=A0ABZ2M8A6_9BACT